MEKYREHLERYFALTANLNCAETTLLALSDALGTGCGLEYARFMAAFGGGMGCGGTCWALIGADSALGRYMTSRLPEGTLPIGDSCPGLRELAAHL